MSLQDFQPEVDLLEKLFYFDPDAPDAETPCLDLDSAAVIRVLAEALRPYRDSFQDLPSIRKVVEGFNDWLLERAPERIAPDRADLLFASVKDAAAIAKVSERTVRRYIATGELVTQRRKGPKGTEHRINLFTLHLLLNGRTEQFARATYNPLAQMAEQLEHQMAELERYKEQANELEDAYEARLRTAEEAYAAQIQELQSEQSAQSARLEQALQQLVQQQRSIEAELRDARAQLNAMNDQVLKALPAPKRSVWEKLAARFKR